MKPDTTKITMNEGGAEVRMRFKAGMRQRKQQYPVAWEKLGRAFPKLNIWYVDTEQNRIEEYPWSAPFDW